MKHIPFSWSYFFINDKVKKPQSAHQSDEVMSPRMSISKSLNHTIEDSSEPFTNSLGSLNFFSSTSSLKRSFWQKPMANVHHHPVNQSRHSNHKVDDVFNLFSSWFCVLISPFNFVTSIALGSYLQTIYIINVEKITIQMWWVVYRKQNSL